MINGNLKAEMQRYGISVSNIASILECSDKTVRNKLSGKSSFSVPEAFKIKKQLFPSFTVEYLFFTDDKHIDKPA